MRKVPRLRLCRFCGRRLVEGLPGGRIWVHEGLPSAGMAEKVRKCLVGRGMGKGPEPVPEGAMMVE